MPAFGPALAPAISTLKRFTPTETGCVVVAVALGTLVIIPRTPARVARQQYEDMEAYGTCRTVVADVDRVRAVLDRNLRRL
ncbi:hypothetical protein ACFXGI_34400 [Streptomyces sp. NPDC059355]|uniref:hypothetical protein n=1 Tax=Streptomyces sp. NPDC059355 TaxID=3346811 RepID=UPI0036A10BF7